MTESVYLNELVDIYLGLTHTPEYVLDGVPFLSVKNISSGTIDFSQCNYITEEEYNSLPNGAKPQCGDMLFCRVGTIGKPVIIEEDTPRFGSFVSLGFFRVKDDNLCKLKYLYYWMYSESFYSQVRKNVKGASQVNLNTGWLKNFRLPLYSLATQAEIVQKLEEVDRLITLRQEQLAKLDELVKSRFVELFGDPIRNTQNRPTTDFINVVKMQRGFDLPVQDRQQDGDIPVFGSNGALDRHNVAKVQGGGVITGRSGTIGKVYYTEGAYWPLNTSLFSVDTHGNNIIYLAYLLQMYELSRFTEGTGVPTLNRNKFHNKPIIDVPLSEQEAFASFVKQTDKSKFEIQQSLEKLETLKKALMQKYFG